MSPPPNPQINTNIHSRMGPPGTTPYLYIYEDSKGRVLVRPWSDCKGHKRQPCRVAFRILLWLVWGPPPDKHIACHMACDHKQCMNPAHGR